jgi:protein TonB
MDTETGSIHEKDAQQKTANDRFKDSLNRWFFGSIMLATVLHLGVFAFFPRLTAAVSDVVVEPPKLLPLPPDIRIPPPPETIERPAEPIVGPVDPIEDITIPKTTLEANPLPPPPTETSRLGDRPVFTPYTVRPEIKDPDDAGRIVLGNYPKILQDAGVGGTVTVWVFVDTNGAVANAKVQESSGVEALDEAALRSVYEFEFTPAWNMDQKVQVWVTIDITFQVSG